MKMTGIQTTQAHRQTYRLSIIRVSSVEINRTRKVRVYLYSAFYHKASNAFRHGSHSFTSKLHHACLYSPAAEHHRPLAGTHFTVPRRVEGWVDLDGWLHTEIKCRPGSRTRTVTHTSTNRAQRRLTSLIQTNDATTTPRHHALQKMHKYTDHAMWDTVAIGRIADLDTCSETYG